MIKNHGLGLLRGLALTCFVVSATACSGESASESAELGTLALPLKTLGASGVEYRLRDAEFVIYQDGYYYDDWYAAAGGPNGPVPQGTPPITVNSEDDPDAESITVDLEQGSYQILLNDGWRLEKVEDGVATDVEATLLSDPWQWLYVSARSTSWVEYQLGIGDRELWLNGQLNINIHVYENPDELYGWGGWGGIAGSAGSSAGGSSGGFGQGGFPGEL